MEEYPTFTKQQLEKGYQYLKDRNIGDIFDCFHFSEDQEEDKCIEGLDEFGIVSGSYLMIDGKIVYTCDENVNHTMKLIRFGLSIPKGFKLGSCYKATCYMYQLIKYIQNERTDDDGYIDGGLNDNIKVDFKGYNIEPELLEIIVTPDEMVGFEDLHLCKTIYEAAEEGHLDCINLLAGNHGQNVNERGYDDETPLHAAVKKNNIETVKLLIELGANVNMINPDRETPLHYAIRSVEMCKILIENGAKINERQRSGYTPLYYASNNKKVVEFLISKGAIE